MLVQAVVAAEDADYFKHGGVDYRGMVRAFIENVLRGRHGAGRLDDHPAGGEEPAADARADACAARCRRSSWRGSCREKLSKEDILALYLNQIYYGHGRYGCEEAARYFFGKSVREIDLAEAALLAGLPQSPERLSPRKHPEAAKTRQRYVLGQMAEHGYIDRKRGRARGGPADPAGARDRRRRAGSAAEAVDVVGARSWPTSWASGGVRERHDRDDDAGRAPAGAGARRRSSAGLEDLDARQGFRGPSGHLTGKPLDEQRARAGKAYAKLPEGRRRSSRGSCCDSRCDSPTPAAPSSASCRRRRRRRPPRGHRRRRPRAANGKGRRARRRTEDADGGLALRRGAGVGEARGSRRGSSTSASSPATARGPSRSPSGSSPAIWCGCAWPTDRPHAEDGPMPLALELGPQAAMVVMDPTTREILALVGRLRLPRGRLRSQPARATASRARRSSRSSTRAAVEAQQITPATILNDAPEVYDALEAAELREGRVPRSGARAHRAGRLDQHGRHQGAVGRGHRPGARVRDARRHHLADRARRRAVAGAGLADGDAARAGQRLRHLRRAAGRRAASRVAGARASATRSAAAAAGARRCRPRSPT